MAQWTHYFCDRPNPLYSRLAGILSVDEAALLETFGARASAHILDTRVLIFHGSEVECPTFKDEVCGVLAAQDRASLPLRLSNLRLMDIIMVHRLC